MNRRCNTIGLAGKPLAWFCTTPSRRITVVYGVMVFVILDFVHLGGVGEDIGELSVNCGWGFSAVGFQPRQLNISVGQPQHEVRRFGHVSNFCTKSSLGSAGIDPQLWHSNVGDVSRVIRISVSGHFQTIDRTTAGRLQTVHGFIASQQLTFVSPCVSRRAASVASLSGPMGSSTSCIVSGRGN